MLPHDHGQQWLPDPIPASYYARGETAAAGGWPPRRALVAGAVAVAGVLLIGLVVGLASHAGPTGDRIALVSPPPARSTPLTAAPTATPTATPTPTPTPALTIQTPRLQARPGRSVTLQATTEPGIACTIDVGYSPPPQLESVTSGDNGSVSWKWKVSSQIRPGSYPIRVSCGGAAAQATITVTRGDGNGNGNQ